MIYNLYVFDRHCQCIYFLPFHSPTDSKLNTSITSTNGLATLSNDLAEHCKLVYGVIYSLRNFINKLKKDNAATTTTTTTTTPGLSKDLTFAEPNPYTCFSTSHFKLHFFETLTKMQWVLITSKEVENQMIKKLLFTMYQEAYIQYVVKNPLANLDTQMPSNQEKGKVPWIGNEKFKIALESLVRGE